MKTGSIVRWLAAGAVLMRMGAAADPALIADFEKDEVGPVPDALMVIEGEWSVVAESSENKVLEMQAEPVVDGAILVGPSLKEGAIVRAKVKAAQSRRSFPRFGVGLYGVSGVKVRVVPARKMIEMLVGESVVAEAPFENWTDAHWWYVELKVAASGRGWLAEGRAWKAGSPVPPRPDVSAELDSPPGQGRPSLLGSPYANKPIQFDEIRVADATASKT